MNPFEKMQSLKEDEIDGYIEHRLPYLRNKEPKEIGLDTTTTIYSGFLDDKIEFITYGYCDPVGNIQTIRLGALVVDDSAMFKYLIDAIKHTDNPLDAVIDATDNYLSLHDKKRENIYRTEKIRNKFYYFFSAGTDKNVSIKTFHKHKVAVCSEIASVAHNMFKFLGIESDLIIGTLNGTPHAFNLVHHWGRDEQPLLLVLSREIGDRHGMVLLRKERERALLSFSGVRINSYDISESYMKVLGETVLPEPQRHEYRILSNTDALFSVDGCTPIPSDNRRILKFRISPYKQRIISTEEFYR